MTVWHQLSPPEVLARLDSDFESGLSAAEIARRQAEFGGNELVDVPGRGPLRILWEQLSSAMVLLLVAAAMVSLYLHEWIDAAAILAIILLNAALGFLQDYRAERALAALKRLAAPRVKVRREGLLSEIPAKELVPGDLVLLEVGNLVPADCRVLQSLNLKIEEASLTGESEPVEKFVHALDSDVLPLGDRGNLAYMGTLVVFGHGFAIVTDTGMGTELGRIARSLQTVKPEPTPLQRRLAQLGRSLVFVSVAIVAVVFGLGILAGVDRPLMLMTALSLAVAIVPEGLPAVATVALAIGARRMFKRQALIRKLPAVETLGSVTVICSDKTGTLTENQMTVTVLDVAAHRVDLTDSENHKTRQDGQITSHSSLTLLLAGAGLCNDAELTVDSDAESTSSSSFQALGEPTEAALILAAARMGFAKSDLAIWFPRMGEVPFDSQRKRMTTLHGIQRAPDPGPQVTEQPLDTQQQILTALRQFDGIQQVAFMKGAVDAVLNACSFAWMDDRAQALDDVCRNRIIQSNDQLAGTGMRVLGVAFRPFDAVPASDNLAGIEQEMVFVGMLGMIDPPRPEVADAVARCRTAGIRPIMITGDHPLTAQCIARQLGITESGRFVAGHEMADKSPADLGPLTEQVSVYARVAPKDKLHIVQALQNSGHVVAMTGDGVNDAPALKQAHIGVAMGQIGTDVSKEAADMVLLDDNFATIVNAVEEGRIVYDNIRKFVKYTMTSNAGEVWVMVLALLLKMPLPLWPLQILWVNLVTDGLPGLALALEPAERETMRRPPYPPDEHIMGRGMWRDICWIGFLMGLVSLAMGFWCLQGGDSDEDPRWRTIVFTVLTLSQMGNALASRSNRDSLFQIGILSNKALLGSVLLTFLLQLGVIYLPPLQAVFQTVALSLGELLSCLLLSTVVFWSIEAKKLFVRRTPAGGNGS